MTPRDIAQALGRAGRPARMAGALVLLAAPSTVTTPARAQAAEPRGPRLEYAPPPNGCPSEETFRHEVAILLGGIDHFRATAPDVVRVTFANVPGGYRGSVQYTPAKGEAWPARHETASLCDGLVRIVAITASMRIPSVPPAPTPPEVSPTPPEPVSKPSDPSPPEGPPPWAPPPMPRENLPGSRPLVSPSDDMDLAIGLSGFVLMTAGYAADVSPGFQLAVELRSVKEENDVFRLGLEFRGLLPSRVDAREAIDPKLKTYPRSCDLSQLSGLAVPCARWRYLLGCGVAEIGAAIRQDEIGTDSQYVIRLGPRIGVEVPFAERFAVRAFGEVLFSPSPAGFGYKEGLVPGTPGRNVTWHSPLASGFFGVGLSIKFE